MEDADIPAFGEALARFRTRAGLSQQRLAKQLGKNRRAIAAWEGGEYLPKTRGDVLELTRILKLNDEESALLLRAAGMDPSLPFWNVPYHRNPYFTGRDELLAQLDQYLAPPEQAGSLENRRVALTQPQAITGLGGIGKTQIAVEYAYRSRASDRYTHTFWVNAASKETILASFVEIAAFFSPHELAPLVRWQPPSKSKRWDSSRGHCFSFAEHTALNMLSILNTCPRRRSTSFIELETL
jgi:transcriptional regulator with XRE-family HTH domain